ncbi:type II secretion system protein GspM [Marinobacterium sediminicola]|uniref:Type II secretion system (T2SS), protein M subtype b n=1 Tax=Marinobacterium sediminicola TaxID=518898 RepID=A0ABY1S4F2_9GAMM|nr:type II secretion system protein GspM [Marinobacterium sediminicola]ULG68423.1 type II secretion system protein GspM [Marinobacterium sediminicola]SMR78511.1 Type II secretion system (T2SS), protein M subtype b [Marinobacterium sediminicola]
MNASSSTRSRWLALGLLLLVVLLLVRVLLVPLWQHWFTTADAIDALETRIDVYERLISALPQEQEHLRVLKANTPVAEWLLEESTPALAAARLQQLLHSQASRNGVQVISTQIVNVDDSGVLQPVAIQAHLRADLSELVSLLYQLEAGQPLLFFDSLALLANPRAQNRTRQSRSGANVNQLDVRLNLTGYTAGEAEL